MASTSLFLICGLGMVTGIALSWFLKHRSTSTLPDAQALYHRQQAAIALLAELTENRNKAEAFSTVYRDMIKKLQEHHDSNSASTDHFIHYHVPLAREAYDTHLPHIQYLNNTVQQNLTQLYAHITPETRYQELDPNIPALDVIRLIEQRIDHAKALIEQMDQIILVIRMIVRSYDGAPPS